MDAQVTTLAHLRLLAEGATPGPWKIIEDSAGGKDEAWCHWHDIGPFSLCGKEPDADGQYIAALSPATVLALLDVVQAAQAILDKDDLGWAEPIACRTGRENTLRAALQSALGGMGEGKRWTKDVPTRQARYWHWDGDEDSAPLPYTVLMSGTSGKCFIASGQYGIIGGFDCDEFGGWWLPCPTPKTPEVER